MDIYHRKSDTFLSIIVIVIIFSTILLDRMYIKNIEDIGRQQARYNLEHVEYCFESIKEKFSTRDSFNICTTNLRTTFTGDIYVLDFNTLEFLFENSKDVPSDKLYFTEESVGKYFKDWNTGDKFIKKALLGKDSEEYTYASYQFDDGIEWLEWKILPFLSFEDNEKYIVVQGIQRDEAISGYNQIRIISLSIIISIIFMLLMMLKRKFRN